MPRGSDLTAASFARRHRGIRALLWAMVIGIVPYSYATDRPAATVSILSVPLALEACRAAFIRSRAWQASIVTLNLFVCASLYVYLAGGVTEAHFIYFVLVGVIALYQDWRPFLIGIALVVVDHVVLGLVMPDAVFGSHGQTSMTTMMTAKLATVHAAFLLGSTVASVVAWKASEVQGRSDELTGLPNRQVLSDVLDGALSPGRAGVSVLFVDLCGFKRINDVYGHDAGDHLLVEVARRISRTCRRQDVVARVGGDEFVIVLPDSDSHGAISAVERVAEACGEPLRVDDRSIRITASIGVVVVSHVDEPRTPIEVLSDADLAMCAAKRQYGDSGGFKIFVPSMRAQARDDFELELDLAESVERGELRLLYQPVVDMVTSRVVGAEALVRWQHPTRGLLGPMEFIPAAERTGLIVGIGRWVLAEAVAQLALWNERFPHLGDLSMHVNLSTHQLRCPTLVAEIRELVQPSPIIADRLVIEITESALLGGDRDLLVLRQLKDLGVRLALDDFGTGYSSLSNLARLPIDELKIDKSFTDDVPVGPNRTLMAGVLALAGRVGMIPIIEGIERPEQVSELLAMGARVGQGYYYSRPLSSESFMLKLSDQPASNDAREGTVVSLSVAGGAPRKTSGGTDLGMRTGRTG
ncbi:MAG: sensor-containing diguanylate cyclase/phosphodiesterase [Ilumatobacteraceae bacterium]|nr:sensor-containing diguanylate cyclase/phosphodiesterase [Ilumatobacteraceae bacterium]